MGEQFIIWNCKALETWKKNQKFQEVFKRKSGTEGMSLMEGFVLCSVGNAEKYHGPVNQSQIARMLGVQRFVVHKAVRALVKRRLIDMVNMARDQKGVYVKTTKLGFRTLPWIKAALAIGEGTGRYGRAGNP